MGMDAKTAILEQKTALGIEFGSTRIKAVLIGVDNAPIASGDHEWENRYDNGVWTYTLGTSGRACRMPIPKWQLMSKKNTTSP